jgi:hypothetical protein
MLRTGFASFDDPKHSFVMVIYTKEDFSLPWSEESEDNQTLSLKNLLERPWTLALLQENGRSTIKFTAHHALYDAQSIQMILSDVAQAAVSQASPNRPSIISLLGAILHNSEDEIEGQKLFWERAENKIVVNRFPDLTSLQISREFNNLRNDTFRALDSRGSRWYLVPKYRDSSGSMRCHWHKFRAALKDYELKCLPAQISIHTTHFNTEVGWFP